MEKAQRKPLFWVGSSKRDLKEFPEDVKDVMGHALDIAQQGGKSSEAKPLKGFGGASILEIVDDSDGDTYRGVYTVKFGRAIYVLHAFQKKSKKGSETPKHEIDQIKARLKAAAEHYQEWIASQERPKEK
jgi:phage-related protein